MDTTPDNDARLHITHAGDDGALISFALAGDDASPLRLPCRHLAGPDLPECWFAGEITETAETPGVAWAHGEHYAMLALAITETGDIEADAALAYERLLTAVRPSRHPFLLRVWNYFGRINDGEGDGERYRRFCVGRARAVDVMFNDPPPAATAIGGDGEPRTLQLVALCGRTPAIALENPRQTPAWRYPRDYGPVAPGFSRGAVLDADTTTPRLLASGTASIVGHVSRHAGDIGAQLHESLANLEALLAEGGQKTSREFRLENCEALRVYLRHANDLDVARAILDASAIPRHHVLYLRGDVCRRELDVELEGVFVASPASG